jgi:hypothetical protein
MGVGVVVVMMVMILSMGVVVLVLAVGVCFRGAVTAVAHPGTVDDEVNARDGLALRAGGVEMIFFRQVEFAQLVFQGGEFDSQVQ